MRAVVAAALSLCLALAVGLPHVHAVGHGAEECAVCVARGGDVASAQTPDLTPVAVPVGEAPLAPGPSPVSGAPLGAIPGQSPPRA